MALDDDGMKNQYLTKLRVKIREDSDIMRELTEMLHDFALSYNAELQSVGNVNRYNPQAQEFLEAWEALRQDFDVWVDSLCGRPGAPGHVEQPGDLAPALGQAAQHRPSEGRRRARTHAGNATHYAWYACHAACQGSPKGGGKGGTKRTHAKLGGAGQLEFFRA